MPFSTIQIVYTGVAGTPWYMNLSFRGTEGVVLNDISDGLAAFMDLLAASTKTGIVLSWDGVFKIRQESDGAVIGFETRDPHSVTATYNQQPVPYATQVLVSLLTGSVSVNPDTGRRHRIQGRVNVPGLTEASMDDGTWQSSVYTAIAGWLEDLDTIGGLVVWSPTDGSAASVTAIIGHAKPSVLRSRRD